MIRPTRRQQDADQRQSTGDSEIEETRSSPPQIERNRSEQRDGRRSEDDPAEPCGREARASISSHSRRCRRSHDTSVNGTGARGERPAYFGTALGTHSGHVPLVTGRPGSYRPDRPAQMPSTSEKETDMSEMAVPRRDGGTTKAALGLGVLSLVLFIGGGFTVGGVFWLLGAAAGCARSSSVSRRAAATEGAAESWRSSSVPCPPSGSRPTCSSKHWAEMGQPLRPSPALAACWRDCCSSSDSL